MRVRHPSSLFEPESNLLRLRLRLRIASRAFCPRREKLIDSPRIRAAPCGAWNPVEFSASTKSRWNWAFRWKFRAAFNSTSLLPADLPDFKLLIKSISASIAIAALKMPAWRLRKCAELVEALSLREVDQRLIRWLIAEARTPRRRGARSDAGFDQPADRSPHRLSARSRVASAVTVAAGWVDSD